MSSAVDSSPSEPPSALATAAAASAAQSSEAKPPQAATAGLRKLKSTVKIPSSLQTARQMAADSAAEAEQKATPQEKVQQAVASLPDQAYTNEEFLAAWKLYGEQVKAAGRQGEYIVLKEAPDLPGDHLVQVRITNSVQQDFFEKARHGAQQFLRKTLQNSKISLECIMVKEEEGKRLYTAQEKFGYLLKKYPQLQELKDRLGLEADF